MIINYTVQTIINILIIVAIICLRNKYLIKKAKLEGKIKLKDIKIKNQSEELIEFYRKEIISVLVDAGFILNLRKPQFNPVINNIKHTKEKNLISCKINIDSEIIIANAADIEIKLYKKICEVSKNDGKIKTVMCYKTPSVFFKEFEDFTLGEKEDG